MLHRRSFDWGLEGFFNQDILYTLRGIAMKYLEYDHSNYIDETKYCSFQRQQQHMNNWVWTLHNLYFIWVLQKPGLMSWKQNVAACVWRQVSSNPISALSAVTPPGEMSVPDL